MKIATPIMFAFFAMLGCRPVEKEQANQEKENTRFDKQIIRAWDYSDGKQYALAIQLCDSILALDPTYERAYFERAMAYLELDSNKLARQDFDKLLSINRRFPGVRDWYSRVLADEKDYLKAAALKVEELREFPQGEHGMGVSPLGWAECAEYFHKGGLVDSAIFILNEYFTFYEKNVDKYKVDETTPLRTYARLMIEKNELKSAFSKMKQAMDSPNKVPADYLVWIEVNILTGEQTKARQVLDYYIQEVHDGYETDDAKRLKNMLK